MEDRHVKVYCIKHVNSKSLSFMKQRAVTTYINHTFYKSDNGSLWMWLCWTNIIMLVASGSFTFTWIRPYSFKNYKGPRSFSLWSLVRLTWKTKKWLTTNSLPSNDKIYYMYRITIWVWRYGFPLLARTLELIQEVKQRSWKYMKSFWFIAQF